MMLSRGERSRALAERLNCPVWQEAFGARAGYPQDHPLFAGHLPSGRAELRKVLAEHDVILSVGAPVFRQYPHEAGPLVEPGTRIAVVTDDPSEANSSPADLAVIANPAALCSALYGLLPPRPASRRPSGARSQRPTDLSEMSSSRPARLRRTG